MKKILCFIQLCLYALGVIGGLGWTIYSKGYVIAAGVAALGAFAFPYIKKVFKELTA